MRFFQFVGAMGTCDDALGPMQRVCVECEEPRSLAFDGRARPPLCGPGFCAERTHRTAKVSAARRCAQA